MKKFNLLFVILIVITSLSFTYAQAVGDYGSAGNGNWGTAATWVVCQTAGTWADATAASSAPTSTTNIWIRNGHTVTVEASGKTFNNLVIENGASLVGVNSLPTSSLRYIRPYGSSIVNNGTFGSPTDVLGISLYGGSGQVLTVSGNGTTHFSRVQQNSTGTSIVFDTDVQLNYAGSSGTGSTALYVSTANNTFTITINAGKTVTMAPYAYISTHTSSGSSAGSSTLTLNIYGTLVTQNTSIINLCNTAPYTSTLNVYNGGVINLGAPLRANTGTGTVNINVLSGGIINGLASSSYELNSATSTIDGTIDFGSSSTTTRNLGTATVSSTGLLKFMDGVFPGGTITLNNGSYVEYYGTNPITLGTSPTTLSNLKINCAPGVKLGTDLTVDGILTLTNGLLTLGTYNLTLGANASIGGTPSSTNMIVPTGSGEVRKVFTSTPSSFTFPIGDSTDNADYSPIEFNLMVGTLSSAYVAAKVVNAKHPSNFADIDYLLRYWTLTQSGITSPAFTAYFYYVNDDINGTETNLYGGKWNGTEWQPIIQVDAANNRFYSGSQTSFSDFTASELSALPVELISFTAQQTDNAVMLKWKTVTENQNKGWEIERKDSKSDWIKIGFVNGAGTSNSPKDYFFADKNVIFGKYQYRLKQIDNNGSYSYSNTTEINLDKELKYQISNYPNPFNPTTEIRFEIPVSGQVELTIYNAIGEKIMTLVNEKLDKGIYTRQFNASNLSAGVYFYKMISNGVTLTKKMLLIK